MAEYIVPSVLLMGLNAGESGGIRVDQLDPVPRQPFAHSTLGVPATEDDGDTDREQPAGLANALNRSNAQAGRSIVGTGTGSPVTINSCSLAAANANAFYVVAPTDIGNGADKLPSDQAELQLDVLDLHPGVFFRAPQRARHIQSQQQPDATLFAITDPLGPLAVLQVDRAPTYSSWVFVLDGTVVTGYIQHPAGSDYRRPRDIWNNIIVPALTSRNGVAPDRALALYDLDTLTVPNTNTFRFRGYASRMDYLNYARFNGLLDSDPSPIFTSVYGEIPDTCPAITNVAGDTTPDQGSVGNIISLTGAGFLQVLPFVLLVGPITNGVDVLNITNVNIIDDNNIDVTFDVAPGAGLGPYTIQVCASSNGFTCAPNCTSIVPALVVQQAG